MLRKTRTLTLACLLLMASPAWAIDTGTTMFSGIVAAIDAHGGVLVVDEIGPGRAGQPAVTTQRTVFLTPTTRFRSFIRVNAPGGFAGDFIEVELDVDSVTPGDFATVECVRERGRLVALRVTLAEAHHTGNQLMP
jgi:hypothetical protein